MPSDETMPALPDIVSEDRLEEILGPDIMALVKGDEKITFNDKAKACQIGNARKIVQARVRGRAVLGLRAQGYSYREIARLLGIETNNVRIILWRARKHNKLDDLKDILKHDSAALAVESLNFHLRKKDKELTKATLEGLGLFRSHSNIKTEGTGGGALPPLQINVQVVNDGAASALPVVVSTNAIGTPRSDDGA